MAKPVQVDDGPDVLETGERMVFQVRSDDKPGKRYRVDLLANAGAGHCACPDFGIRRQPAIDEGKPIWTKATSCKHTRRAAWHVIRTTFPAMAKEKEGD